MAPKLCAMIFGLFIFSAVVSSNPSPSPSPSPRPSPSSQPSSTPSPTPVPDPSTSSQPPPPPPPFFCSSNRDCGSGRNCKRGTCTDTCFPGDALVHVFNRGMRPIKEINVGDKVAVSKGPQGMVYSDVYAFGHKDPDAVSTFLQVHMEAGFHRNILELTGLHFLPSDVEGKMVYKRAQDLKVGDTIWGTHANASEVLPFTVTEISSVSKLGLFNPFTLAGEILVNNAVASSHSDWFLDPIFDSLGVTHWLPHAYQLLLAPARALYVILGKEVYSAGYTMLDAHTNIAEFGTKHGGAVALTVAVAGLIAASKKLKI